MEKRLIKKDGKTMSKRRAVAFYYLEEKGRVLDEDVDAASKLLFTRARLFVQVARLKPIIFFDVHSTRLKQRKRLFSKIRKWRIKKVIVQELSHILQPGEKLVDLVLFFNKHGVFFLSIKEGLDTSSGLVRFNITCDDDEVRKFLSEEEGKERKTWNPKNRIDGDAGEPFFPPDWNLN